MYITYEEFLERINEYSLPDGFLVDGYNSIMACIEDASSLVRTYISIPYDDFNTPDSIIKRVTANIAFFYLMNKRGFDPGNQSDTVIANEYTWSLAYLERVQNNQVILSNKSDSVNNLRNKPFVVS